MSPTPALDGHRTTQPPVRPQEAFARPVAPREALQVLMYFYFPGSGIGRYTHELLGRLVQFDDIRPELVCLPGFEWRTQARYPVWPHLQEISHPAAWRRRWRFLVAQFVHPYQLLRHAAGTHAEVVHLATFNHLTFPLWRRLTGPKRPAIAATVHDIHRATPFVSHAYEDRQLRRFYRDADALFVHSRSQAAELQNFADVDPERICLVPHGPYDYGPPSAVQDELRARLKLPRDKQVALFFGNIRDDKNLDLLLQIWPKFRDDTHLLVAGRGAGGGNRPVTHYRSLVDKLSLAESVTFIDRYIGEAEIPDLFAACDWVALPYSRRFTSQSGVLNVAVAYGRPVVASGAPTFSETLEACDIGVLVDADDGDALAAGIERLRERIVRHHVHDFDRYRREFSWEENARRTVDVYRTLASRRA